jgi:hypothetical protein
LARSGHCYNSTFEINDERRVWLNGSKNTFREPAKVT